MTAARSGPILAALAAAGLLVLAVALHVAVGAKTIPPSAVLEALWSFDPASFDHAVIREMRLPRALIAAAVGASLAVAGALMQGVTRNPLAEPGLLGLMAGASLAVVVGIGVFGVAAPGWQPLLAAAGALGGALSVWVIAAAVPGGTSPLALVLAGAAVSALLGALVTLAHLLDPESFRDFRVWLNGTLAGRETGVFLWALPWMAGGFLLACALARQVTALAMGEEAAAGLGVDVGRLRLLALLATVTLTAAAVAVAGPLAFVGLVVPHAVRVFTGADYARIVPWSAFGGALFLLLVDTAARVVLAPLEISAGLVTALIGAPLFVWLVRARL
jgi:iron complex transport system permease protein